jgi:hypothetical protein
VRTGLPECQEQEGAPKRSQLLDGRGEEARPPVLGATGSNAKK